MEISYGQGPCDEYYIPPNENGNCPEGHRFVDKMTECVPARYLVSPPSSPPLTPMSPAEDLPCDEPGHELVDGKCLDLRDDAGVPSDNEKSSDDNTKDNERIRIDDPPLGGQQGDDNENEDEDSDSDVDNGGQ